MQTPIGKWGNSLAVRIPGILAKDLGLREGMELDVTVVGGELVLCPPKPQYPLEELVARITPKNVHGETDWDRAVGGANPGSFVPNSGDLVWLSFLPQAGRE